MSNRRFILFFTVGIAVLSGLVWFFERKAKIEAQEGTQTVLCSLPLVDVESVDIMREGTLLASLSRTPTETWELKKPFHAEAETQPVSRLLDAMTLTPLEDRRSETEIAALGAQLADFGLERPRWSVLLRTRGREERISFGASSASGREVYACSDHVRTVFMVPSSVLDVFPANADDLRQRTVLPFRSEEVSGVDFRIPDAPFLKLVRQAGGWRQTSPTEAPAESPTVDSLVSALLDARIAGFVIPSAEHPQANEEGIISKDTLATYGLAAGAGLAVTVRSEAGLTEQIVFGGVAGSNLVYALVRNGAAVVTMDAALAERCRVGDATFRDMRVFPLVETARVKSISITEGALVYVLAQGRNGVWRLESPVVAPTDPVQALAVVEKVLRLKQNDLAADSGDAKTAGRVRVTVSTGDSVLPGVWVPKAYFGPAVAWTDLRSKTMLELDAGTVRRLTMHAADGDEVVVVRDAEKGGWKLDGTAGSAVGRLVDEAAIKKLLAALARVDATSVETVSATPDDFTRCGLVKPSFTLAIDVDSADAVRRNLLLGGAASGGGRYATVGGVDAIFVVSRQTVADLMASVMEK